MLLLLETVSDYELTLARIETYLAKDAVNLTEIDLSKLRRLSELIEQYENPHYPMPVKTA